MGNETKTIEIKLLETWKRAGFSRLYRYKSRIKGLMDVDSKSPFELMYDINSEYFEELKDLAHDQRLAIRDVAMKSDAMLEQRLGVVSEETKLNRKLFRDMKFALRQIDAHIRRTNLWGCVVLINWYNYEVLTFENKEMATNYLLNEMKEWDSISAGEDEELEVITFCSDSWRKSAAPRYDHYVPFRVINGEPYYRHRRPVKFEEIVDYYPSF